MIKTDEMFYAGIPTFMGSDYVSIEKVKDYDVGVLGVPIDNGASYRIGAKYAPRVIREYSAWDRIDGSECYDYDTNTVIRSNSLKICDLGDINVWPGNPQNNQRDVADAVEQIRKTGFPLVFGGDHSITYGAYIGCKRGYGKNNIGLLHFDAHNDLEDKWLTLPDVWHGNVFRKLIEGGHVNARKMLSIGVRGIVNRKWYDYARENGVKIITSNEVNKSGVDNAIQQIHELFKDCDGVYISFDIDCLDISLSPGTGTPKYNGLKVEDVVEIIRSLKDLNTIGFDLVELNPKYDKNGSTALLACEILYNFLAYGLKVNK